MPEICGRARSCRTDYENGLRDVVKAPAKTVTVYGVKVHCEEGIASHFGLKLCVDDQRWAWRSVSRGTRRRSMELRNYPSGAPTLYYDGEGNMNCKRAGNRNKVMKYIDWPGDRTRVTGWFVKLL